MSNKPAVFLDFDGTILDSFSLYFQTTKYLFPGITEAEYRDIFTRADFLQAPALSQENVSEFFNLIASHSHLYSIFPGVLDGLHTLSQHYDLIIVTACPKDIVKFQLSRFELPYFAKIYGKEKVGSKRDKILHYCEMHNLQYSQCYFVTDTLGDLLQVQDLDICKLAVSYGFHDHHTLSQGMPHYICDSFNEVQNIIIEKTNSHKSWL